MLVILSFIRPNLSSCSETKAEIMLVEKNREIQRVTQLNSRPDSLVPQSSADCVSLFLVVVVA